MSTERTLYRTPIAVSLLLHAAVLVPVLMRDEPAGLAEGTGGSGFAVSIATADGATGAPGTEAPDIETVAAAASPDEVSLTAIEPEESADEPAAELVDTESAATAEADDSEPESVATEPPATVTAAAPDAVEPMPAPPPELPAPPPPEAQADQVETVADEESATAAEAREPQKTKAVGSSMKETSSKSAPLETAERTAAGKRQADRSKAKAGDDGDGSAESGSGAAAADSSIRRGMADYQLLLQAWLERHKKYPRRAERRNLQGTAMLRFTIDRDGNILSYRIQESSGHAVLDEEVEAMIRRAAPLPPVPEEMQSARLEFVVPVQFSLR